MPLVALDVDGTLAGPEGLHPDAVALLDWLTAAHVDTALCSARPVGSLRRIAAAFPCVRYAASLQGSVVHRLRPEPAQLAAWPLPPGAVAEVLDAATGHEVWLYTADDWFVAARTAAVDGEIATVGIAPRVSAELRAQPFAHKLLVLGTDGGWLPTAGTRSRRSGVADVEVIAAATPADKGLAVILGDAGVDPADVVAVGDGANDLGMLGLAGRPFALPPLAAGELGPGVTRLPNVADGGLRALLEHLR